MICFVSVRIRFHKYYISSYNTAPFPLYQKKILCTCNYICNYCAGDQLWREVSSGQGPADRPSQNSETGACSTGTAFSRSRTMQPRRRAIAKLAAGLPTHVCTSRLLAGFAWRRESCVYLALPPHVRSLHAELDGCSTYRVRAVLVPNAVAEQSTSIHPLPLERAAAFLQLVGGMEVSGLDRTLDSGGG